MLRELTATNKDGVLVTKSVKAWAAERGVTTRYLCQRKRLGFNDHDIIYLPRGKSPKKKHLIKKGRDRLNELMNQFLYNRKVGEI